MIDEYFDRLVDRWCEAVPRAMRPRMILLANSAIGWRMQLYFGTLGRNIAGLFSRVKDETQMDLTLREGSEQIDWLPLRLHREAFPFSSGQDIGFFEDASLQTLGLRMLPGQFAVFFPEDAHKPLLRLQHGHVKKAVFKIPLEG